MTHDTPNSPPSFKQMIKEGTIKRADAMKVRYEDLHVEDGFNLRDETDDFHESCAVLAAYISEGGIYPPLEVRPRAQGGVWIVDGHRRHRALGMAIEQGAPIEWIEVRAFSGNDADRTARIMTSAEGRPLSQLERSRGYKRLHGMGLTTSEIAKIVHKTRPHVESLLVLSTAPIAVQHMVRDGVVSASIAIDTVRERGEAAGEFLSKMLGTAKAEGKAKVTSKTIHGKAIPQSDIKRVMSHVRDLFAGLDADCKAVLAEARSSGRGTAMVSVPAWTLLGLEDAQAIIAGADRG